MAYAGACAGLSLSPFPRRSTVMTVNSFARRGTYPASCQARRVWPPPWRSMTTGPDPETPKAIRVPSLELA